MKHSIAMIITILAVTTVQGRQERPTPEGRPEQSDWKISAGIMGVGNSELLHSDEGHSKFRMIPFVWAEYKGLYWKATELGYTWQPSRAVEVTPFFQVLGGIGLAGAPSVFGGKGIDASDMAAGYKGISDRATQFEAGARVEIKLGRRHAIEFEGRGGERGGAVKTLYKQNYMGEKAKWIFSPFIAGRVLLPEIVEYYFGITEAEANDPESDKINSSYQPDHYGYSGAIGFSYIYRFNPKWSAVLFMETQAVSDEINDSPLVQNRIVHSGGLGLSYSFK